jgi:hypothetical protein
MNDDWDRPLEAVAADNPKNWNDVIGEERDWRKRDQWERYARNRHWPIPKPRPLWKRLPIIRHVIMIRDAFRGSIHNGHWRRLGLRPAKTEEWILAGRWKGWI